MFSVMDETSTDRSPPHFSRKIGGFIFLLALAVLMGPLEVKAGQNQAHLNQTVLADSAQTGPDLGQQEAVANRPRPSLIKIDSGAVAWRSLRPGLDLLELKLEKNQSGSESILSVLAAPAGEKADLAVLRSDPERFEYTLHMASEDGLRISLLERAKRHGLHAAINAGMYLPDNLKNTGYMRSAEHINNPRIVSNFGAFFMAEPLRPNLPKADLQEKSALGDNLNSKLADYKIVIQNYRLTSLQRDVLWPENHQSYSITALGRDKAGRILFIVCEFPLSAPDFARIMLNLPIDGSLAMYLEGGSQAGMVVREDKAGQPAYLSWRGRHGGLGGISFYDEVPLPNVLGLKPRSPAEAP